MKPTYKDLEAKIEALTQRLDALTGEVEDTEAEAAGGLGADWETNFQRERVDAIVKMQDEEAEKLSLLIEIFGRALLGNFDGPSLLRACKLFKGLEEHLRIDAPDFGKALFIGAKVKADNGHAGVDQLRTENVGGIHPDGGTGANGAVGQFDQAGSAHGSEESRTAPGSQCQPMSDPALLRALEERQAVTALHPMGPGRGI